MSVKSQTLTYETHSLSISPCRIHMILIGNYHQTLRHYRPRFCTLKIRIENVLKTQAIRSVYSIPNSQSPLITDNALHCIVTHLPVYQSNWLIYQRKSIYIIVYQSISLCIKADPHSNALLHSQTILDG